MPVDSTALGAQTSYLSLPFPHPTNGDNNITFLKFFTRIQCKYIQRASKSACHVISTQTVLSLSSSSLLWYFLLRSIIILLAYMSRYLIEGLAWINIQKSLDQWMNVLLSEFFQRYYSCQENFSLKRGSAHWWPRLTCKWLMVRFQASPGKGCRVNGSFHCPSYVWS